MGVYLQIGDNGVDYLIIMGCLFLVTCKGGLNSSSASMSPSLHFIDLEKACGRLKQHGGHVSQPLLRLIHSYEMCYGEVRRRHLSCGSILDHDDRRGPSSLDQHFSVSL